MWDCKAVKSHIFTPELMKLWDRLKNRLEDRLANKEFIKILLLGRQYTKEDFMTVVSLALEYGAVEYAAITNILIMHIALKYFKNCLNMRRKMCKLFCHTA